MLWLSTAAGVFLAFAWWLLVSPDPASEAFRLAATATTILFLAALAFLIVLKALGRRSA